MRCESRASSCCKRNSPSPSPAAIAASSALTSVCAGEGPFLLWEFSGPKRVLELPLLPSLKTRFGEHNASARALVYSSHLEETRRSRTVHRMTTLREAPLSPYQRGCRTDLKTFHKTSEMCRCSAGSFSTCTPAERLRRWVWQPRHLWPDCLLPRASDGEESVCVCLCLRGRGALLASQDRQTTARCVGVGERPTTHSIAACIGKRSTHETSGSEIQSSLTSTQQRRAQERDSLVPPPHRRCEVSIHPIIVEDLVNSAGKRSQVPQERI